MTEARIVGRYAIFGPVAYASASASGGTAAVRFGRLIGPVGFSRTVAIRRVLPERADDADFVDGFVKEAKRASRVRHPNVVVPDDVVAADDEVLLVMEYLPGESLARLLDAAKERGELVAQPIAAAILVDVLRGLHAMHEAKDEAGDPLRAVHRDLSAKDVLVGADGVAHVVVVARAPRDPAASEEADVRAACGLVAPLLGAGPYADVIRRATSADPAGAAAAAGSERFASADDVAAAIAAAGPLATRAEVAAFVAANAKDALEARAKTLADVEKRVTLAAAPPASSARTLGGERTRVVFGLVLPPTANVLAPRVDELAEWMGDEVGVEIVRRDASSYEALAMSVREGKVDVAWLPPIVYVRLAEAVNALGSIQRDGRTTYEATLVVRAESKVRTIDALRGTRAGWVDPWSAAGFVLPRIKLAILGVDPRALFRTEKFLGSHRAAIEALVEGACDVAGTYARADANGEVVTGAWSEVEGANVRVLATMGAIPPDVVAARRNLLPSTHEKLLAAFRAAGESDEARPLLRAVFGGETLREDLEKGYESLRNALDAAIARGLFD